MEINRGRKRVRDRLSERGRGRLTCEVIPSQYRRTTNEIKIQRSDYLSLIQIFGDVDRGPRDAELNDVCTLSPGHMKVIPPGHMTTTSTGQTRTTPAGHMKTTPTGHLRDEIQLSRQIL